MRSAIGRGVARRGPTVRGALVLATMMLGSLSACSPSSLVDVESPSNVVDPKLVNTAAAAVQLRNGALLRMVGAANEMFMISGYITDELADTYYNSGQSGNDRVVLDLARGKSAGEFGYDQLQGARVRARQAREALQRYATGVTSVPEALQGEMYAIEGYTLIWFAEIYCSGIPLTDVPLSGQQTPTKGFTTTELYTRAIALFDSAMTVAADSARFVNLARVGKGRALLGLGQIQAADSAVRDVPTDFVYTLESLSSGTDGNGYFRISINLPNGGLRAQDHEGGNGLVWSTDARTGITTVPDQTDDMLWPAKYNRTASGTPDPTSSIRDVLIRLADGLEARLIQSEAALARGDDSWLTILNTLRSNCVGSAACAPIAGIPASFSPLADPGTPAARLDTLMKERAMWLYFTAHREGDLRRMAKVYNRDRNTLWPTGAISIPTFLPQFNTPGLENGQPYGPDVVYQPDQKEKTANPLYGGCYDTNP